MPMPDARPTSALSAAQLLDETERFAHLGTWSWDPVSNEVVWSDEMFRIFGYDPKVDRPSLDAFFVRVHPDDAQRLRDDTSATAKSGRDTRNYEYRIVLPSGEIRHLSVLSLATRGPTGEIQRIAGTIVDVTHAKRAAEELRLSNELLADAQRIGKLGSFEVSLHGDQTPRWSDEMYRVLGLEPGVPASIELFVSRLHPDDRPRIQELIAGSLATGRVRPSRARVLREDGSIRHVDMRADLHKGPEGEPLAIRGTVHDVTDLVELESQFHQSQKMEAIGQLAGGLAHDYNNLLTVILGNAESLLAETPRPELREIVNAAATATTVTNRLLAFTRQTHGSPRATDLTREVEGAIQLLRRAVGDGISLRIDLAEESLVALVDEGQVQQVLLNLVLNARDAMQRGGAISVRMRCEPLSAELASEHDVKPGDYVTLSVSDTGHGMDEATQRRAFEPFFTTKRAGHGTGLGLAMVFGAMRQCQGFVELSSKPGGGATFKLWFPRLNAAPAPAIAEPKPPAASHARILLVEDNAAVSRVTAAMLKAGGYAVDIVSNATDAVRVWREEPRDLLVTDVAMPDISGVKLVEMLRSEHPELRVLFVTGYSSEQLGADLPPSQVSVLTKPFRHAELLAKVKALLIDIPLSATAE